MNIAAATAHTDDPNDGVMADNRRGARSPFQRLDTTRGSWIHRTRLPRYTIEIVLVTIAATIVPLLILASLGPNPMLMDEPPLRLPILQDANLFFMFGASLPCVLAMLSRDQSLLLSSLGRLHHEKSLEIDGAAAADLCERWSAKFANVNRWGQLAACVIGVVVGLGNAIAYSPQEVGHWMARDDQLLLVGYYFIVCVAFFYFALTLYVVRAIWMCVFLRDLVRLSTIRPLPLHPDRSGGLRPIGELGLRNQYMLAVLGTNLALLIWVSKTQLHASPELNILVALALVAFSVLGPVVFLSPLMPFRAAMKDAKAELKSDVAIRLRHELRRIRETIKVGDLAKGDEETIERLRKIGAVIDEIPVWPFDIGTLGKFSLSFFAPVAGLLASLIAITNHTSSLFALLRGWLFL